MIFSVVMNTSNAQNIASHKQTNTLIQPPFIKKGDTIFEEGDAVNGVYCIKDGICKLSKLSANGKDQIIKLVVKQILL